MIKELYILVKMMFQSKPSGILGNDLEVVVMNHFPFKGYRWLMWCGRMVCRADNEEKIQKEMLTTKFAISKNHERIHLMQALTCNDSWVRYYLSYLWEWLRIGFMSPLKANYYTSKYESEAYANEDDYDYCGGYDGSNLSKYVFKNRKKLYKSVGGTSRQWKIYLKTL
jgi:hypothetical protein